MEYVFSTLRDDEDLSYDGVHLLEVEDEMSLDPTGGGLPIDSISIKLTDYDGVFNPENPNNIHFNFVDGSLISYELGFRFYTLDDEGASVETVELIPCGSYYLRTIEYEKGGEVTITGESLVSYLDYDYEDGRWDYDRATMQGVAQQLGDIADDIISNSPIMQASLFNYILGGVNCVLARNSVGMPLGRGSEDYWRLSPSLGAGTTELGLPTTNARTALCYLATAVGTTFKTDRFGVLYDEKIPTVLGAWTYVLGEVDCSLDSGKPLFSFTQSDVTGVVSITRDEILEDYEYTLPQHVARGVAISRRYAGYLDSISNEQGYQADVDAEVVGVPHRARIYFDKPLYGVVVYGAHIDGVLASEVIPHNGDIYGDNTDVDGQLAQSVNYVDVEYIPHIIEDGRTPLEVMYLEHNLFETRKSFTVSGDGDVITFDNPIVDDIGVAEQSLLDIITILLRPIYTIEVYDDPAVDLGDVVVLSTEFAEAIPTTLIGRKRTFDGAIKSEYTLR